MSNEDLSFLSGGQMLIQFITNDMHIAILFVWSVEQYTGCTTVLGGSRDKAKIYSFHSFVLS